MIVPRFWSESKLKKVINGKSFTVKRFGWSDESEFKAKEHADERLASALIELERNGEVRRMDHKISYNGAEGIPIREEVISKYDDVVISRNSYGALCLNTPDILFADIDFDFEPPSRLSFVMFLVLAFLTLVSALIAKSWVILAVGGFFSAVFSQEVARKIHLRNIENRGGLEQISINKIQLLSENNSDLNMHVYKTPKGLRVLFLNKTYLPGGEEASELLRQLDSDKTYIQMCKNQNCFRARVSPKPWRIGMGRLKPTPGVWPIKQDRMKERTLWVSEYEEKSRNYASCHFARSFGSNRVNEKAQKIKILHDELCKAHQLDLKLG